MAKSADAARAWGLFRELLRYVDAGMCRHDFILRYFGDENELLGGCGHCDVCESESSLDSEDESVRAATAVTVQKALSGVARANRRAGIAAVASMLVGIDDEAEYAKPSSDRTLFMMRDVNPPPPKISFITSRL